MKFNKWTLGLAAVGVVSLTSAARADEKASAVQTAFSNTTISGYVSTSANLGLTGGYDNSPAAGIPYQSGKANGFNLDVVKLTIAKPQDESPWASGYQVDLLAGPDAVGYDTVAGKNNNSDVNIQQAYVNLRAPVGNGLDFKVGVFDGPLGYEGFDAGYDPNYNRTNPNYTHSYGYALDHTSLTGVQATYKFCDFFSVSGGIADTSAAGINNRDNAEGSSDSSWHKDYFGTVTLTAPTSWGFLAGSQFFAGVNYGYTSNTNVFGVGSARANYMGGNQVNYYGGLTLNTPWKELATGVAFDYVRNAGGGSLVLASGNPVADTDIWSLGLYASYKATDKLSFNARGEYVEADDYNNGYQTYSGSVNLVELTGTVEYDLWANVVSRLEVRWDHNLSNGTGGIGYLPVGSNPTTTEGDSVGLYANIIYKF